MAKQREKLALSCTGSDCANSLHCYRPTRKMKKSGQQGACRSCFEDVVDWERIHHLDVNDLPYLVGALQTEFVRAKITAMKPNQWAQNYACRKGRSKLLADIPGFIRKHVGGPKDAFDGRRVPWPDKTPQKMNPYYYAQHATGTCCRSCIETWYGIPPETPLPERAIVFFTALIADYITQNFPKVAEEGRSVPPIRIK
jgi:hypothetical protein